MKVVAVYLDAYLLINTIFNALTLLLVARVSGHATTWSRLCLSTVVGTVYSLLPLLPYSQITCSWPARLMVLMVMILIAFDLRTWGQLVRLMLYCLLVVSVLGGATYALAANNVFPFKSVKPISSFIVVLAAAIVVMSGTAIWRHLRTNAWKGTLFVPVEVTLNGRELVVKMMLDTGNSLIDPLSKKPVIVVRYGALKSLLPPRVAAVMQQPLDADWIDLQEINTDWIARFRLIPFNSIGHHNGWLLAFKPDRIRVKQDQEWCVCQALVAVVDDKFLPQGSFAGLMHPAVMQADTR